MDGEPERLGEIMPRAMDTLQRPGPALEDSALLSKLLTEEGRHEPDIPAAYARWGLRDYGEPLVRELVPWYAGRVWSVCLMGPTGSRKSSLAAAMLAGWRALYPRSWHGGRAQFVPADLLMAKLRDMENAPGWFAVWKESPVLVLDDLGAARNTPYMVEQAVSLVCARWERKLPTIVTTNITLDEIAQSLDARVASRLQDGILLDMGTRDWRGGA